MRISPIVVFIFVLSPTYTLVVQGLSSPRSHVLVDIRAFGVITPSGVETHWEGEASHGPSSRGASHNSINWYEGRIVSLK